MAPGDRRRVDAVRERVLADHRETLAATHDAADAVAADAAALADGAILRRRLRTRLGDRGLLARYPDVLRTAVDAAGLSLAAEPVAAPPYVVVASRGPLCRGSTDDGRLVLAVRVFALRAGPNIGSESESRYVRSEDSLAESLAISRL